MKTAYIQTAATRADGTRDSFATIPVDLKDAPLWYHDKGLTQTASGYGSRLTTPYMVRFNDNCGAFIAASFPILARFILGNCQTI